MIGNKNDLENKIEESLLNNFLEEHKYLKYISTSAKDNININEIFEEISQMIYIKNPKQMQQKNKLLSKAIKKKPSSCSRCINKK